jgi:hypothetical protein
LEHYKKIILTTDQDLIKDGIQAIDNEFLEWFVNNPSCDQVEVKEKQHFEADKSKRINPLNGVYYSYKIIIPQEEPIQLTVGKEFYESADKNITVYKQDIIQLIEDRILSEYKKHSTSLPNEWAKIAAYKIYKSISDKMEEPKQETIEKAAKNYTKNEIGLGFYPDIEIAFEKGVKWQAEQDREEIGLLQIELNHTKTLLQSCEKALEERDNQDERMYSDEEVMNALHSVELKYNKDFTKIYEGMKEWFKQFKKK